VKSDLPDVGHINDAIAAKDLGLLETQSRAPSPGPWRALMMRINKSVAALTAHNG
jgi:hypothetical protein